MTDSPIRTMVVGEEREDGSVLEDSARARGYDVEVVRDGQAARERYLRDPHDLILHAASPGGEDGPTFCRRFRELPASGLTVVLLLGDVADPRVVEEALESGADDVIGTPVTEASVQARLAVAERRIPMVREHGRDGLTLQDPLTGLASHPLLVERVQEAIRREARDPDHVFALMELNLDAFGPVTQRLGKGAANRLLADVAERVERCVRDTDLVARTSEDRFTVLLDELHDLSDPARVARRIHQAFAVPFRVEDEELRLSTGIGIALSLTGYDEAEKILWDAHNALRRAKVRRRGATCMYDPEMDTRARERIDMEDQIRSAIEEDRIELWYQPILSLGTGDVVGVEALARMRDVDGGLVPPGAFIPVAEDSGLIEHIGWLTLERASTQIREWQTLFPSDPPLSVSVNLSSKQFSGPAVYDEIRTCVEKSELPDGSLHLEITESTVMSDVNRTIRTLRQLKDLHVAVHVDDFGTGYSSLNYLCRLPVDTLKIDRAFIDGMSRSGEDREVVRTILHLARTLDLDVVAEGVETSAQADLLKEMECELAQGFYFHRPMPPEDISSLFRERLRAE